MKASQLFKLTFLEKNIHENQLLNVHLNQTD